MLKKESFLKEYRLQIYWCPIMIKGYLKILFLKKIKTKECTGYDLINSTEEVLGKKPSAGSVYPLLNQLLNDKFIKVKEEDRRKIYSITKKGELLLLKLIKEKEKMLSSHKNLMGIFGKVHKEKTKNKHFLKINEHLKLESKVIMRNMDVFLELKDEIDKILLNNKLTSKKEKEVRTIIKETTNKLKTVRKKK